MRKAGRLNVTDAVSVTSPSVRTRVGIFDSVGVPRFGCPARREHESRGRVETRLTASHGVTRT